MSVATLELAQSLGMSETELLNQAIKSLLQEKRRDVLQTRLEILSRYQVNTLAELEDGIRQGTIPEHPAWEDLITAENLENRLKELEELGEHHDARTVN
jgi:hypothetical protein